MSLLGVVAAGCSNHDAGANVVERSDSSGIEIVMNDATDRQLERVVPSFIEFERWDLQCAV